MNKILCHLMRADAGDVLIGDSHGNRFHVVVFTNKGSLLSEFECPHVKVSRCCGLKISSEGKKYIQ